MFPSFSCFSDDDEEDDEDDEDEDDEELDYYFLVTFYLLFYYSYSDIYFRFNPQFYLYSKHVKINGSNTSKTY